MINVSHWLGALVGVGYIIGKAAWAGEASAAFDSGLLIAALVGAGAGAIAFFLRGRTG